MHRTTISIEVLSEEPLPESLCLADVVYETSQGEWVGFNCRQSSKKLTTKEMADALYEAGSDPGFFSLDDNGNKAA